MLSKKLNRNRAKRKKRVSAKIHGTALRPRLSVFRSSQHVYVQAVDDDKGITLEAVSTLTPALKESCANLKKTESAKLVGKLIAQRLMARGLGMAVFDRGSYLYHGRIRALAEAAREAGMRF